MLRDRGKLLRMKAQIERIDDAAPARNTKEAVHVRGVGPHHGADAVAGLKAKSSQSGSQTARAPMEISVGRTRYGSPWASRDHFRAREKKPRPIQQVRQGQREIHHRSAHRKPSQPKAKSQRIYKRKASPRQLNKASIGAGWYHGHPSAAA